MIFSFVDLHYTINSLMKSACCPIFNQLKVCSLVAFAFSSRG